MMRAGLIALLALIAALGAAGATAGTYTPPAGDVHPVWSPDGSVIVYLTKRAPSGLHVMRPDGSGDRLLPLPAPDAVDPPSFAFSQDWFWVAFGSRELVVSRPDGSDHRTLGASNFGSTPAWSPDGRRLAFPREYALYTVNVDGSGLRLLTAAGASPSWSPDGALIAFTRAVEGETDVLVVRPDSSGERNLTQALPGNHYQPVWSPDGSLLALVTQRDDRRSVVTILTREGGLVGQFDVGVSPASLAWSPDGRRVVLSGSGLFVLDVGSGTNRLLSPFGFEAAWAPDGRSLAFAAGGECKDRPGVYRVPATGGRPVRLTNDCRIFGTPRADRLRGTDLADILLGLGGDDRLTANSAAYVGDDIYGGAGDDVLLGDFRGEVLDGGDGRDRLDAQAGPDLLRGGPGRDELRGDGGRDQLLAEDGRRDVVSCGTNRLRATGPEGDVAFVDRRDRVSRDCELLYRGGRADLRAGRTALRIVSDHGQPDGRSRVWTLRCRPPGGTLPDAAAACGRLAAMRAPLAPVPYDRFCPFLNRAGRAIVSGTLAGRRLTITFSRSSTCEVDRWARHTFLLMPR